MPAVLQNAVPGCCLGYGPYIGTLAAFPGFNPTAYHPRDVSRLWTKPRIKGLRVTRGLASVYWAFQCVAARARHTLSNAEVGGRVEHHLQDLRCGAVAKRRSRRQVPRRRYRRA